MHAAILPTTTLAAPIAAATLAAAVAATAIATTAVSTTVAAALSPAQRTRARAHIHARARAHTRTTRTRTHAHRRSLRVPSRLGPLGPQHAAERVVAAPVHQARKVRPVVRASRAAAHRQVGEGVQREGRSSFGPGRPCRTRSSVPPGPPPGAPVLGTVWGPCVALDATMYCGDPGFDSEGWWSAIGSAAPASE